MSSLFFASGGAQVETLPPHERHHAGAAKGSDERHRATLLLRPPTGVIKKLSRSMITFGRSISSNQAFGREVVAGFEVFHSLHLQAPLATLMLSPGHQPLAIKHCLAKLIADSLMGETDSEYTLLATVYTSIDFRAPLRPASGTSPTGE